MKRLGKVKRYTVKHAKLNWKGRWRLMQWMFSDLVFVVIEPEHLGVVVGKRSDKVDVELAFDIAHGLNQLQRRKGAA